MACRFLPTRRPPCEKSLFRHEPACSRRLRAGSDCGASQGAVCRRSLRDRTQAGPTAKRSAGLRARAQRAGEEGADGRKIVRRRDTSPSQSLKRATGATALRSLPLPAGARGAPNFARVFPRERTEFKFSCRRCEEFIWIGAFGAYLSIFLLVDIDAGAHGLSRPFAVSSASGNPAGPEASIGRPASPRPGARRSWPCRACRRSRTRSRKRPARWRCRRRS